MATKKPDKTDRTEGHGGGHGGGHDHGGGQGDGHGHGGGQDGHPENYHEKIVAPVDTGAYPERPYSAACSCEHAKFLREHGQERAVKSKGRDR